MTRIALLSNPASGQGAAERAGEPLRAAGAVVETFAIGEAEVAASTGAERLAVAGGDGSIGAAAAAAGAAGIPLAVIPCGTANDFAAHLGIVDVEQACVLAANGRRVEQMELSRVGERPFVNVAGAGLAPAAAEEAAGLKEKLGALAYPVGAVGAGLNMDPIRCTLRADGELVFEGDAWQVSIASSGAFGGGSSLLANTSDGKLDLVVIERGSRARLLKHAYGLRVGVVEDQAGVLSRRAKRFELAIDPGESINVDGELIAARELSADGVLGFSATRSGFDLIVG
jgi:diacylglycerol kinase family enzyme